ncbi:MULTISPECIES: hypothetical protein [Bradyrhizobium]|uniref:hypothetical protein n=1 Tax=Bradyrhizobium TaxID=374 RepID=UPI00202322E0|nr:hypothetical protein [Bradyrhizobium denitrificans]MCL8489097.1 hypothetical protein [Bradyrhizobium denitrificans]
MSLFGTCRMVSGSRVSWRAENVEAGNTTERGQGKSPCPDQHKPLAWLVFSWAWRSVAGILPGFCERFQRSDMHGTISAPIGGLA